MTLSVDNLYNLDDQPVRKRVLEVFVEQLQNAPSVRGPFFGSVAAAPVAAPDQEWTDNVAAALVCSSIGRSSLFGFAETIDVPKADAFWQTQLASQSAIQTSRYLYDWAFGSYCQAEGHTFQEYLNDNPQAWGAQLAERVTSPAFINTFVLKVIGGDADWPQRLNLIFYKIHRLNDALVQQVVNVWRENLPDKNIQQEWQTYNFIPGHLFQVDKFLSQVNSAIGQNRTDTRCNRPVPPVFPTCTYTTYYGEEVAAFLNGKATLMHLTTGRKPDNVLSDSSAGGGGCFVPGTPVLLADGSTLPIEAVQEGHQVVSKDGFLSTHTDEKVIVYAEVEMVMYGFNEFEPFFSSGHPFWTQDGWKAIEPEVALEINPTLQVGKLSVGDTVYRVKSVEPFAYEEITIERLSTMLIAPGEKIYCLHLEGHPSYHANGFLVRANYPIITENRLFQAFAAMTDHERQLIVNQLQPILPLLRKTVGFFIEAPLQRALITSHQTDRSE